MSRSQSRNGAFIATQFYHIFCITILHSTQYWHAVYIIYKTQKNGKVASIFDVTLLNLQVEDNEFSENVFEVSQTDILPRKHVQREFADAKLIFLLTQEAINA